VLSAVAVALAVSGAIAGAIGSWSPCGFSMVATLAAGCRGSRARLTGAGAAFGAGTLIGGLASFASFSTLGVLVRGPVGASAAAALALGLAVAGALLEARRLPVRPQIRRQVPEPWRRVLPLPLAGALYGVLLGLGFTTFVMSWVYWALAGVCVALASPELGLAAGLGFGLGRALPVLVLAPLAERPSGVRLLELMSERPAVLGYARWGGALSLAVLAIVVSSGPARAAALTPLAAPATDPTADQGDVAWQVPGGTGLLLRNGQHGAVPLPGTNPALGGPYLALRQGDRIAVLDRATLQPLGTVAAPGADVLAVSAGWLVYRRVSSAAYELHAVPLPAGAPDRVIAVRQGPAQLGRPAIDGNLVVFATASSRSSTIDVFDLAAGRSRVLLRSRLGSVLNPALRGRTLLFERLSYCSQQLRLASLARPSASHLIVSLGTLGRRDRGYSPGHTHVGSRASHCPRRSRRRSRLALWTTALVPGAAYVTELGNGAPGKVAPRVVAASL
jgi:hypothetical protein